jgi:hypothetical protein
MADSKLTELIALNETPNNADIAYVVDVSDTTDSPSGTSKKITISNMLGGKANAVHTHTESSIPDLDKYTKGETDTLLSGKANTVHTHTASDVTDFDTSVSGNTDVSNNTSARHPSTQLGTKTLDETAIADGKVIAYEESTDTLNYITPSGGGAVTSVDGLIGDVDLSGSYDPINSASGAITAHELAYDHDLIATALQTETDPVWASEKASYATASSVSNAIAKAHDAVTLATDSGLGLTGQTLNIGTPSTITSTSTNSVTAGTHTHAITGAMTDTLASGNIYVGNSSNVATGVAVSGDAVMSNTGVLSVNKTRLIVRNETGVSIPTTRAVYVGGFNNYPLIALASNITELQHNVVGITVGAIGDQSNGYIATGGQCDAETNGWAVGTELYLSTAGQLTATAPVSGSVSHVAIVTVQANYPTGKLLFYRFPEENYLAGGANVDTIIRMGDSAGVNKTSFRDYDNNEVGYIDSNGVLSTSNLTTAQITDLTDGGQTTLHSHAGIVPVFECTVGTGGDYATVGDALTAGKRRILLISSVTETMNWTTTPTYLWSTAWANLITMGTYYVVSGLDYVYWRNFRISTSLTTGSLFPSATCSTLDTILFTGGSASGTPNYFGDNALDHVVFNNCFFEAPRYKFATQTGAKSNHIMVNGGSYVETTASIIATPFTLFSTNTSTALGIIFRNTQIRTACTGVVFTVRNTSANAYPQFIFEGGSVEATTSGVVFIETSYARLNITGVGRIYANSGDLIRITGAGSANFNSCGFQCSNILNNDTTEMADVSITDCTLGNNANLNICRTTTNNEPKVTITNLKSFLSAGSTGTAVTFDRKWIMAFNNSGGALARGDVVDITYDATYKFKVVKSTTAEGTEQKGVCMNAVNNNNYAPILIQGYCYRIKVDGTTDIIAGDNLATSTTAGISVKTTTANKAYAMAFTGYTADNASGVIDGVLYGQLR